MKRQPVVLAEKIGSFARGDRERVLDALEAGTDRAAGTADILVDLGMDADTVIAALVLGGVSERPLPEAATGRFGPAVTRLVNGAVKIERLPVDTRTILEAQNIRNMIFALTDDIRVIMIKLAEKLNALRLLDSSPDQERKARARECLDIYAPLASRLGMFWLKDEMEDLSLKFINREAYQQIKNLVAQKKDQRGEFLELAQTAIRAEAEAAEIRVEVKSRAKHFYSVYMKMRKRGKSADEIYDLSGIRILCDSIENCYTLLGIVHRLWTPISGCFDDYVAKPKPNGYQSLHTSVLSSADGEERRLEIQIRTKEMHQMAENGVASHWLYKKSSGSSREAGQAQDIGVMSRLKEWKHGEQANGGEAAGEFSGPWLDEIKRDIFRNSIYTLTPLGRVIKLPAGATPIDFAYSVHTAVGERCVGAKANGSIVPLSAELKNTQVVEILTSSSGRPHRGWLETVKTAKARGKIRSWLEENDRSLSADKPEKTIEKKKPASDTPAPAATPTAEKEALAAQRVLQPLKSVLQVRIQDEKNLLIRFARCCSPVTGDSIIGYVSRGRGIIIHRETCPDLANNPELESRRINAAWESSTSALVKRFRIDARQTANLFSEIEGAIRRRQGHLIEGRLEEVPGSAKGATRLTGFFTIQLVNAEDLKPVIKNIRGIPGILGIQQI
ncbi:MAG: HD domain-containing protein [Treponema sp.]|nr:HD domain-containing protein [Treponema sp.]